MLTLLAVGDFFICFGILFFGVVQKNIYKIALDTQKFPIEV